MKLLVLGNHTSGNRGDSAIMRGLLDAIGQLAPDAHVDVMSRFPVSSGWLQGRAILADPLYQLSQRQQAAGGRRRQRPGKKSAAPPQSELGAAG